MCSRLFDNSEAFASELSESLEESLRYYMNSDVNNRFKSSTTHGGVTRLKILKKSSCLQFALVLRDPMIIYEVNDHSISYPSSKLR